MFLVLRGNMTVRMFFSEVYMTGWLEVSVCCAEPTKGHWKESRFCTEYKKILVFIKKIMLPYVVYFK